MAASGTPWSKLYSGVATSPKLKRLARAIGKTKNATLGDLAIMWCLATTHYADGDLTLTSEELEDEIEWDGERGLWVSGCIQTKWLVEIADGYRIYNWMEYAESYGRALRQREKRARQSASKRTGTVPTPYRDRTGTVPTPYQQGTDSVLLTSETGEMLDIDARMSDCVTENAAQCQPNENEQVGTENRTGTVPVRYRHRTDCVPLRGEEIKGDDMIDPRTGTVPTPYRSADDDGASPRDDEDQNILNTKDISDIARSLVHGTCPGDTVVSLALADAALRDPHQDLVLCATTVGILTECLPTDAAAVMAAIERARRGSKKPNPAPLYVARCLRSVLQERRKGNGKAERDRAYAAETKAMLEAARRGDYDA